MRSVRRCFFSNQGLDPFDETVTKYFRQCCFRTFHLQDVASNLHEMLSFCCSEAEITGCKGVCASFREDGGFSGFPSSEGSTAIWRTNYTTCRGLGLLARDGGPSSESFSQTVGEGGRLGTEGGMVGIDDWIDIFSMCEINPSTSSTARSLHLTLPFAAPWCLYEVPFFPFSIGSRGPALSRSCTCPPTTVSFVPRSSEREEIPDGTSSMTSIPRSSKI